MEDCAVLQPLPGVYHIQTPGNVFVTLLTGSERALLVDTGLGICDLRTVVRSLTALPLTVVNTHGHNDHIAGNYQFERVMLSAADMPCARFALDGGIRANVLRIRQPPAVPAGYMEYALENIAPLDSCAVFDLGGLTAEIIPLPNHTPGSVGVYVPERALLLGADSVAPFTSLFFPEACMLCEHLALLRRVEKLPFSQLLCSHSAELYPKKIVDALIGCVRGYDKAKTVRYRDQYFPYYTGRLYFHRGEEYPEYETIVVAHTDDPGCDLI